MAGGTFDPLVGKVRPGTYINFQSTRQDVIPISERGVVLLPLVRHNYGPAEEFFSITMEDPDAAFYKLGYSIYDDSPNNQMLLIREAFKRARKVILYIPKAGTKAGATFNGITATARYGGTRGNDLKFVIIENPVGGYDVEVYLSSEITSKYEGITSVEELIAKNDGFIEFSGSGTLSATAGVNLTGGTDAEVTNSDISRFLDAAESEKWNTMAFPIEEATLKTALKSKITYMRESVGKYVKAVAPNFRADYDGIINVTNSVVLNGETNLTVSEATAWVAGADAGASYVQSNTYAKYDGATAIIGVKNHEAAVAALKNGEYFFSYSEEGDVIVEQDINSFTSFTLKKDKTYAKNRVSRVFASFAESIQLNFPPNKYNNDENGWNVMEGIGRSILKQFQKVGAIKNVDTDADFLVDRTASSGDETFFNVGLEPVDSAEKLYFTISTR